MEKWDMERDGGSLAGSKNKHRSWSFKIRTWFMSLSKLYNVKFCVLTPYRSHIFQPNSYTFSLVHLLVLGVAQNRKLIPKIRPVYCR